MNSLLPKINKLKCITNKNKTTITGIKEAKLDHTVTDLKVILTGCDIL